MIYVIICIYIYIASELGDSRSFFSPPAAGTACYMSSSWWQGAAAEVG